MRRTLISILLVGLLAITWAAADSRPAAAQSRRDPHLAYAFPAGCQQGASYEMVLGGQHLKAVSEVYLSGQGVEAEIVKWYRPMTRGEFNNLRMMLDEARKKLIEQGKAAPSQKEVATAAGVTDEQLREMEIYRERDRDSKRQPNEQLEEELTLKVTIAKNAEPGKHELRVLTETAMSNPVWIQVGTWPEVREKEPNDQTPDTVIDRLPIVVNGQIMPGDVDVFSLDAKKGARLVIVVAARDVIPYLADAVPGWFQAVVSVTDSKGAEVSYGDSFHYRQDPLVCFEVPRDDRYTIRIHDSLYRGREDFVYRLTVGEIPIVTTVFPLGVRFDVKTTVDLEGWNLTQTNLTTTVLPFKQIRPTRWYSVPQGDNGSVRVPLQIDTLPEVFDKESNNDLGAAQSLAPRMIVNGRIDFPGDEDIFHISAGGRLALEVHARRHGSPLDSALTLTDGKGKELAFNDDYEDKSQGFMTHHADSHLVATVPAGGCYVHLADAQGNGGKEFVYRLYVRAPEPDFELRVTPGSIIARAGAVMPIMVYAARHDNFGEDIDVALVNPPQGFQLAGGIIPGKADRARMTLTVPTTPPPGPVALEMTGTARRSPRNQATITRPVIPAENMMQAFIWYHLVPVEDWNIVISGKPGPKPPFDLQIAAPRVALPLGGEVFLPARAVIKDLPAKELHVELNEPPKGVSAEIVTDETDKFAVKLTTKAGEAVPGLRGNLLLFAYRETTPAATIANPNPKPHRTDFGYFPALPFEISGRSR